MGIKKNIFILKIFFPKIFSKKPKACVEAFSGSLDSSLFVFTWEDIEKNLFKNLLEIKAFSPKLKTVLTYIIPRYMLFQITILKIEKYV